MDASPTSVGNTRSANWIHPAVETTGLPVSNQTNLPDVGLTAKVVAGNEKVIETSSGVRLPFDPALGDLKTDATITSSVTHRQTTAGVEIQRNTIETVPARTNAQFPPLPIYGTWTWFRWSQIQFFRVVSTILSTVFLLLIVCGAVFQTVKLGLYIITHPQGRPERPLKDLEDQLDREINEQERKYGKARLKCDVRYYAKRVGLDVEEFKVTTEDGFILVLQHIFDPSDKGDGNDGVKRKYPVLLIHGLLQSAGAFCANDDNSLAFYLCKNGYDVWLGNNRCYYKPEHMALKSSDPRMWCWNIRQMGILDLPAFVDFILSRTEFQRLALVAHSQGTTQSFVAMAKDQHPNLGSKISIFCALAPAVYAGPLIKKAYFKFMKLIPAGMFRLVFGIHSFIPFMITMHSVVPGRLYGWLGYRVFTYLFSWSDVLWSRKLRSRGFMFSPVYVSSESMRWWLGRDGFATHKCILATRKEVEEEERMEGSLVAATRGSKGREQILESRAVATTRPLIEDGEEKIEATAQLSTRRKTTESKDENPWTEISEEWQSKTATIDAISSVSKGTPMPNSQTYTNFPDSTSDTPKVDNPCPRSESTQPSPSPSPNPPQTLEERRERAWFNESFPPLALWVCGSDKLVDGTKLLNRLERGAEPDVNLVHAKVIPPYEHLDCIWAIDSIQQVGVEVKTCIWRSITDDIKRQMDLRTPSGCEGVTIFSSLVQNRADQGHTGEDPIESTNEPKRRDQGVIEEHN
ncbi:hypothetical protein ABW19_dt0205957 [Dactylella cylindrospora]|nr:hypothetical protein ABW19_dt0205957 [Dactylella cylindrospora]